MKKLKLNVEALRVESFSPGNAEPERGTVHGHARYTDPAVCPWSNNWYCSVGDGCTWDPYTCYNTCGAECYAVESID